MKKGQFIALASSANSKYGFNYVRSNI